MLVAGDGVFEPLALVPGAPPTGGFELARTTGGGLAAAGVGAVSGEPILAALVVGVVSGFGRMTADRSPLPIK